MILLLLLVILWRAPDSAKRVYWWAVQETLNPATTLTLLDDIPVADPDFKATEPYFPQDVSDEFGFFSALLEIFHEPSIYADTAHPAVRLLYVPSFYDPVMVRLFYQDGRWMLISKRATGGVHIPHHIEFEQSTPVSDAFVSSLKASLERIGFWSMPTAEEDAGLDGAEWVPEARLGARYHLVNRWSPDDKNEFKRLCVWMLKKGGVAHEPLFFWP